MFIFIKITHFVLFTLNTIKTMHTSVLNYYFVDRILDLVLDKNKFKKTENDMQKIEKEVIVAKTQFINDNKKQKVASIQ